jgi:hypothetical protein
VAAAAADLHALELGLQRLAAAARASLGTLERLSVGPDPAIRPAVRQAGGSVRDWDAMPLPALYRGVPVSESIPVRRIYECLSHLRLASDILAVFAPLPNQAPPPAITSAASVPARLTTASSAGAAPHVADPSGAWQRRAYDPAFEFESPEEDLTRGEDGPARTLRTEGAMRSRVRSSQSAAREILRQEHISRDLPVRFEQDDTSRNEMQFSTDRDRNAPSMKHAARHCDSLRRSPAAGSSACAPPAVSASAQRGKPPHSRRVRCDDEPDGVLVLYPRQLPAAGSGAFAAGLGVKRKIEACGPKLPDDGCAVPRLGGRFPIHMPPVFRA